MLSILRLEGECIGLAILGQGVGLKVCFQRHGQFLGGCVFLRSCCLLVVFKILGCFQILLQCVGCFQRWVSWLPFFSIHLADVGLCVSDDLRQFGFLGRIGMVGEPVEGESYEDQVVVGGTIF